MLDVEVDAAAAEWIGQGVSSESTASVSFPSFNIRLSTTAVIPHLGYRVRRLTTRQRRPATTADSLRTAGPSDSGRRDQDLPTPAGPAAGLSGYPTLHSKMEPGSRRAHHFAAKKSTPRQLVASRQRSQGDPGDPAQSRHDLR